jgi:hypothetical protein
MWFPLPRLKLRRAWVQYELQFRMRNVWLAENGCGVFQAFSWADWAKSRITQSKHPVYRPRSNPEAFRIHPAPISFNNRVQFHMEVKKGEFSLCSTWRYEGVKVQFHPFLTSALDGNECSDSSPGEASAVAVQFEDGCNEMKCGSTISWAEHVDVSVCSSRLRCSTYL